MSRYAQGWSDPRGTYQTIVVGPGHTYEIVEERQSWWEWGKPRTYSVMRISRYAVTGDWKPYKEAIYTGLSKETAEGYVKLLNQPED